jgi:hypothetical protein
MGGQKGNVIANTGYACALRQLITGWRAAWSKTPGTTDPLAPFGVVTLASSGSEGGPNFGAMRIAQTLSYGVLPTPTMPNTFVAQAYDLDDEWGPGASPCLNSKGKWGCCPQPGSGSCGSAGHYNATSCAGREALCATACAADWDTPCLMGGIHVRGAGAPGAHARRRR